MGDHSHKNPNLPESSSGSEPQDAPQGETSKPADDKAQSRRRFLKASLVSVPMIVTLRSRPAHAQVSLGSVGNIFYGRYEMFLRDRTKPFDAIDNPRDRWAPADQDGNEMVDPTRRNQSLGSYEEPTGQDPNGQDPNAPSLDSWSPDQPSLDSWSPD